VELKNFDQFIRAVHLKKPGTGTEIPQRYPFTVPAIRELKDLAMHPAVTFFVGENGTGKSTLMEAIAIACGFNPEGGTQNFTFETRASHSELHQFIKLVRGVRRPQDGFFLRGESFYNVATHIDDLDREGAGSLVQSYGGTSLHEQSHGEAFFSVMMNRFGGRGLYILDEPEAALSPARQMSMLSRMHQLVQMGSQFLIATHSPIIMAYPQALLYEVTEGGIEVKKYNETTHYFVMKSFLNNPEGMLKILLE